MGKNCIIANLPTYRCSNALLITLLKRITHSQNLSRKLSRRCRVHHHQSDILCQVDDKDRANREINALFCDVVQVSLVNHVVGEGYLAVGVGDDGELEVCVRDFVDVVYLLVVRAHVVGTLQMKVSIDIWSYNENRVPGQSS